METYRSQITTYSSYYSKVKPGQRAKESGNHNHKKIYKRMIEFDAIL